MFSTGLGTSVWASALSGRMVVRGLSQVAVTSATTTRNVAAVTETRRQSMARIEQVSHGQVRSSTTTTSTTCSSTTSSSSVHYSHVV